MIKISEIVDDIISHNAMLEFGMSEELLNLSNLARFLKPLVETRIGREVSEGAIKMALSRYKNQKATVRQFRKEMKINSINVNANLTVLTFPKTERFHSLLGEVYKKVQAEGSYATTTESSNEITLIIATKYLNLIKDEDYKDCKFKDSQISAVRVNFDEYYTTFPGMIFYLVQKITIQNINIIEIASTFTELIFYVKSKDVNLTFETLYNCFSDNENI